MTRLLDLSGQRFGLLVVTHRVATSRPGNARWACLCDCGNETSVLSNHLRCGRIKSCGCLQTRKAAEHPNWDGYGNISGHHFQLLQHAASGKSRSRLDFLLTKEYLSDLYDKQGGKCALSSVPLVILVPSSQDRARTASLDRIDNTVGYVEGNVQWVHKYINMMKNKLDQDLFIDFCKKVAATAESTDACLLPEAPGEPLEEEMV